MRTKIKTNYNNVMADMTIRGIKLVKLNLIINSSDYGEEENKKTDYRKEEKGKSERESFLHNPKFWSNEEIGAKQSRTDCFAEARFGDEDEDQDEDQDFNSKSQGEAFDNCKSTMAPEQFQTKPPTDEWSRCAFDIENPTMVCEELQNKCPKDVTKEMFSDSQVKECHQSVVVDDNGDCCE